MVEIKEYLTQQIKEMDDQIFTTGAYLEPVQIGGAWMWVVSSFEDDSFMDGEIFNPPHIAETRNLLLINTTKDE